MSTDGSPRVVRAALALSLCVGASPGGAEEWVRVRSRHHELLTDAGAGDGKRVARRLEQFRHVMSQVLTAGIGESAERVPVLAFRNQRSFAPFAPQYEGKAVELGGLFLKGPDRSYLLLNLSSGWEEYENVYHEQVHLILSRAGERMPAWIVEGLAELYSTWRVFSKVVQLGHPRGEHLEVLVRERLIPLEQLVAVDHDSPFYNEGKKAGIFYAQSWALVHYLVIENYPRGFSALGSYADAVASGKAPLDAFRGAFGDHQQLERKLKDYVGGRTFRFLRIKVTSSEADEAVEVATPPPAEVQFRLGDVLLQAGRLDEARPYLVRAAELDDRFAPAQLSLARVLMMAGEYAPARAAVDRALDTAPQDARAHYLRGEALLREAAVLGSSPSSIAEAARSLDKALELDAGLVEARRLRQQIRWVSVLSTTAPAEPAAADEGDAPPRRSAAAVALDPARRLARVGDFAEAAKLFENLAASSPDPVVNALARVELERVRREMATKSQVEGDLIAFECGAAGGYNFVVRAGARTVRLHARGARELVLYGSDGSMLDRSFTCGAQKPARVRAVFSPGPVEGVPAAEGLLRALYFPE
jgi:tetratricopeptide (TPR) repeat protein